MTAPKYKEGQRLELLAHQAQIRRLRRWLVLVSALAAFSAVGSAVGIVSAQEATRHTDRIAIKTKHDTALTTSALCALRHDMQVRVQSSLDFLRDHPDGFAGVDADTIRNSVENQVRTIRALSVIHCTK